MDDIRRFMYGGLGPPTLLTSHIERTHPGASLSENAIDSLWKCFYFFAHHPFPCESTDKTANESVDADAFHRAVALLAHQGPKLLVAQEAGYYFWRHDETFLHRADCARVLRSIGHLESTQVLSAFEPPNHSQSALDDIMDVLATTQPYSVNLAPSPTHLEAVARRLLAEGLTITTYRLSQTELSTFLVLLLRLGVSNDKWGRNYYFGSFADENPVDEVLANAMAARLIGSDEVDFDKALEMKMDALVRSLYTSVN
ncbi:hypothetical protein ASPACDRAFT_44539 [Aspergillus aculeatus ATCC 16872]|uniref:Uncharacterized protein n=1 Tax=Aspergillus aculeatus (strain ATCC 16872 / CBS 172.66 / WB 5094) TaxID=690307 RepID=A0A1L9WRS7_ASPA1|nr:uncharacterized protein ASPACDRAFT_44539 [Aspergillus aculeatus ATCC 16872]OJJ98910.1 hypothetical protein ASPACDRAFT_44539 [Aspergillus aculeatus ATCC 16872]